MKVYLTFDDGPVPGPTEEILDILKERNIKATFFCVGDNIEKHPAIFKRVLSEGHQVGNHSNNHLNGKLTSFEEYKENVEKCDQQFFEHGVKTMLFRPPYGKFTRKQIIWAKKRYKVVMWEVLTRDFAGISYEECLEKSVKYSRSGSVVLFHDSLKTIDLVRQVLPDYLDKMLSQGYRFDVL